MSETSWELHQKRRILSWKLLIILLLLAGVAGIIIYNNRDFILGKAVSEHEITTQTVSSAKISQHPKNIEKTAQPVVVMVKSPPVLKTGSKPERQKEAGISTRDSGRANNSGVGDSIILSDVACRVSGRNDVRVHLSLVLYVATTRQRHEIMVQRDALAVMVQNVVRGQELETLRIGTLRPLFLKAMSAVLDTMTLTDIKLRNISIEKVSRE
jgi:hypothetical protein